MRDEKFLDMLDSMGLTEQPRPAPPSVDFRFCRGRGRHDWKAYAPALPTPALPTPAQIEDSEGGEVWRICKLCGLKNRVYPIGPESTYRTGI